MALPEHISFHGLVLNKVQLHAQQFWFYSQHGFGSPSAAKADELHLQDRSCGVLHCPSGECVCVCVHAIADICPQIWCVCVCACSLATADIALRIAVQLLQ